MKHVHVILSTNLGWVAISRSYIGLRHIVLSCFSPEEALSSLAKHSEELIPDASAFGTFPDRLIRYLHGEVVLFPDALDTTHATPFQDAVWEATLAIPYGEARSYTWIAQQISNPRAIRAVGQALAKNPLPIVVPCHRVVGSGGRLGGYSGGLELKQYLLHMESKGSAQNGLSITNCQTSLIHQRLR